MVKRTSALSLMLQLTYGLVTVASLGLVSPVAATDGVTLFCLSKKTDDLFSHRLWRVMTFI